MQDQKAILNNDWKRFGQPASYEQPRLMDDLSSLLELSLAELRKPRQLRESPMFELSDRVTLSASASFDAKRSSSVSAKPPQDPWGHIHKGHYGHHVGMIDEDTSDLPPVTPVDAAAKRHDDEYADIQSRYTWSEGDTPTSVWFKNYYKIDDRDSAFMHAEFIYSDLALAWRTVFNIGAGLFDGSYDLTFSHGPQGWINLFSDLLVAGFFTGGIGVIGYAVVSAAVHVVGFAASIAYQVVKGIFFEMIPSLVGAIAGGLHSFQQGVGRDISREWKNAGGAISDGWKDAGGAISDGWKSAGGAISDGWKSATSGIKW